MDWKILFLISAIVALIFAVFLAFQGFGGHLSNLCAGGGWVVAALFHLSIISWCVVELKRK
jgi:uncharacterized membrane protein